MRMRQIPALRHVPIVVSSGYMNAELEEQFAAMGVKHFLDKPCCGEELVKVASMQIASDHVQGTPGHQWKEP
jgi:CheY-like chemotaxis protein